MSSRLASTEWLRLVAGFVVPLPMAEATVHIELHWFEPRFQNLAGPCGTFANLQLQGSASKTHEPARSTRNSSAKLFITFRLRTSHLWHLRKCLPPLSQPNRRSSAISLGGTAVHARCLGAGRPGWHAAQWLLGGVDDRTRASVESIDRDSDAPNRAAIADVQHRSRSVTRRCSTKRASRSG